MEFIKGDRVELIHTSDMYTKLVSGARGTVVRSREDRMNGQTVFVNWDDGSSLSMLIDEGDQIRKITERG